MVVKAAVVKVDRLDKLLCVHWPVISVIIGAALGLCCLDIVLIWVDYGLSFLASVCARLQMLLSS